MKNRTYQRLFPLMQVGSILLATVLFFGALLGVDMHLSVGTSTARNLATYLGLLLTLLVVFLLDDVSGMLFGKHLGWKLTRYEAFGRVYQADSTGEFQRVPTRAASRLRYRAYLLPPENVTQRDVTRYMLVPLCYSAVLFGLFGALTLLTLGQPVSLVLCELSMGALVRLMSWMMPMNENFSAPLLTYARMMKEPEQLTEWLYFARMQATGRIRLDDAVLPEIPKPTQIRTHQDAVCVIQRVQTLLLIHNDYQEAYRLTKEVLASEVRLSRVTWKILLSDGVTAELLSGAPGEFAALYQGKEGKAMRQTMFRTFDGMLAHYAVSMLMTHEEREAEVLRNSLAEIRKQMPTLDQLMREIEEKAAQTAT